MGSHFSLDFKEDLALWSLNFLFGDALPTLPDVLSSRDALGEPFSLLMGFVGERDTRCCWFVALEASLEDDVDEAPFEWKNNLGVPFVLVAAGAWAGKSDDESWSDLRLRALRLVSDGASSCSSFVVFNAVSVSFAFLSFKFLIKLL